LEAQIPVAFPEVDLEIIDIDIPADRTPLVTFSIENSNGLPLDRNGIYTEGPVDIRFMLTYIPMGEEQKVNYHDRLRDRSGTYTTIEQGLYTYKFTTVLPEDWEQDATHTLAGVATRDLRNPYELSRYYDNEVYNFVPSGVGMPMPRDVMSTETCNRCHDPLGEHGADDRDAEPEGSGGRPTQVGRHEGAEPRECGDGHRESEQEPVAAPARAPGIRVAAHGLALSCRSLKCSLRIGAGTLGCFEVGSLIGRARSRTAGCARLDSAASVGVTRFLVLVHTARLNVCRELGPEDQVRDTVAYRSSHLNELVAALAFVLNTRIALRVTAQPNRILELVHRIKVVFPTAV